MVDPFLGGTDTGFGRDKGFREVAFVMMAALRSLGWVVFPSGIFLIKMD